MIHINLKEILKERGKTMSELSEETGISRATLSLLSSGKSQGIQFKTLESIMRNLGLSNNELSKLIKIEYSIPELKLVHAYYTDNLINLLVVSRSKPEYYFLFEFSFGLNNDEGVIFIQHIRQQGFTHQRTREFTDRFNLESVYKSLQQSSLMFPKLLLSLTPEMFNEKLAPLIIDTVQPLYKNDSSLTTPLSMIYMNVTFTSTSLAKSSLFSFNETTLKTYSHFSPSANASLLKMQLNYKVNYDKKGEAEYVSGILLKPHNLVLKDQKWEQLF